MPRDFRTTIVVNDERVETLEDILPREGSLLIARRSGRLLMPGDAIGRDFSKRLA